MTKPSLDNLLLSGSVGMIGDAIRRRELSVQESVGWFLARIESFNQQGPKLNCVKDVSRHAQAEASLLDAELAAGRDRGPLHGIPILFKDNISIAGEFTTTAGAAALMSYVPTKTATLVQRLRDAGAIILGKTKMTEFADFVSDVMPSEFSGAGGVVRNPHGIAYDRGQGSSVGSAAVVAAGFAPLAIGTETQNSIQTPACYSSVVGFKPSVGAVSRAGIVPLVPSQDSPGPLARTVEDAALVFAAIRGGDPRDTASLLIHTGRSADSGREPESLAYITVGVPRIAMADRDQFSSVIPLLEAALGKLSEAGARIVDPCDLPSAEQLQEVRSSVFRTEFKAALNTFLEDSNAPCLTLEDIIRWNEAHTQHIPYGQSLLIAAQATDGLHGRQYLADRAHDIALSRTAGIGAALEGASVDILIAPMGAAAKCTGKAGAPALAIPVGHDDTGTPFGVTLYTSPGNDRLLLAVGRLVEKAIGHRLIPSL